MCKRDKKERSSNTAMIVTLSCGGLTAYSSALFRDIKLRDEVQTLSVTFWSDLNELRSEHYHTS